MADGDLDNAVNHLHLAAQVFVDSGTQLPAPSSDHNLQHRTSCSLAFKHARAADKVLSLHH